MTRQCRWFGAVLILACWCIPANAQITINEIRIDEPGADVNEYFELAGPASASLNGHTYLVIGDTGISNSGIIEAVIDLTGQAIGVSGYFLAVEVDPLPAFGVSGDMVTSLNFENSDNVTHLLVTGFSGLNGDDLDTNDDGILDVTPWTTVVDLIALVEEPNPPVSTEYHYGNFLAVPPTAVGPDGPFVPGQILRLPDGTGAWQIGQFSPTGGVDTPGAQNKDVNLEDGATLLYRGNSLVTVDLTASGGTGGLIFTVLAPLPTGTLTDASGSAGWPRDVSGTLQYTPPSPTFTGLEEVNFRVRDGIGTTAGPAIQYVATQGDEVVISEVMHTPSGDPDVFEYVEIYNYSAGTINLSSLGGDLMFVDATANLTGKSIGPGEFKIIAPNTTAANNESFRCEWRLAESNIIRVAPDSWQSMFDDNNLIGLFDASGGLLDALFVDHEDVSWPNFTFTDTGHAIAAIGADIGTDGPLDTAVNDDLFGLPPWDLLGLFINGYVEEALQTGESGLNFGNPGWVPTRNEGFIVGPACVSGECCLVDASCQVTFEAACTTGLCGTWSAGGDCSAPGCVVVATEACCTDVGDCFDVNACGCALVGGTLQGGGTNCGTTTCPVTVGVIFNEIDYDNPGTDAAEFIELLGPPGTSLVGWSIGLYNGLDGLLYDTIALSGTIPADRFYLIGPAGMANIDATMNNATNNLQNGPDGVVLIDNTSTVVQLLAYEGTFTAADGTAIGQNLPDIGASESGAYGSLQRIPNGETWTATVDKTPGATNVVFDSTCRTVAEAKVMGVGAPARLCDVIVTTALDMSGNNSFKTFFVQDTSGPAGEPRGIQINGTNAEIDAVLTALGGVVDFDTIQVEGVVAEFDQFLLEDGAVTLALVEITATAGSEPTPVSVLTSDLTDSNPRAEELSSVLVQVDCVWFDVTGTFSGLTNYVIRNGDGPAQIRIATTGLDLVGTAIPTGAVNIKGLITQFGSTYSIRPRSLADITTCVSPPIGACCVVLACSQTDFNACGGTYMGDFTTCGPNPCLLQGACCLPNGACLVTDELTCITAGPAGFGGAWNGATQDCAVAGCGAPSVSLLINEVRIDQSGADNSEYFEIFGPANTSLQGLTYLVIGDGTTTGSGTVEAVVPLDGLFIPNDGANGYFVAAESTFETGILGLGLVDLSLVGNGLNFENSDNVTHLLVAEFTGLNGDDLDTNDDGILDVTPWKHQLDLIALIEETNPPVLTEFHYGPPTIGPDVTFVPGQAWRNPDGGTWTIGTFDPLGTTDTPGATNVAAPPCVCLTTRSLKDHGAGDMPLTLTCSCGIEPRFGGITKLEIDVDDASSFAGGVTVGCAPTAYAGAASCTAAVNTVTCTFTPGLPDETCCDITLDCGATAKVCNLEGDSNNDAATNPVDNNQRLLRFGQTATVAGAQWDVNADGSVNPVDNNQTLLRFGNSSPACP